MPVWLHCAFRKRIEKYSLAKCKKVIALSQFTKDKLISTYGFHEEKIAIIPGGVDLDWFKPPPDKMALKSQMSLPIDCFILFTVRNLVPRMGLENLIKAMALLHRCGANVKLIIGGQGFLKEKLQSLIDELNLKDNVSLCGFLTKEDLVRHYQMADFFVLPPIELEGFGLVTVEAMACATPVFGTPIGSTKEILGKFDESLLFKETTPESIADLIAEKIKYFAKRKNEYQDLCANCRTFVEEHYSWQKNITETGKLFDQCAASAEN